MWCHYVWGNCHNWQCQFTRFCTCILYWILWRLFRTPNIFFLAFKQFYSKKLTQLLKNMKKCVLVCRIVVWIDHMSSLCEDHVKFTILLSSWIWSMACDMLVLRTPENTMLLTSWNNPIHDLAYLDLKNQPPTQSKYQTLNFSEYIVRY